MCGIVGWWNMRGEPVDRVVLDRFTDSLAHRGPDGRGTYVDARGCLGLGHRRLAILDVSDSGHQPMAYGDGRYRITYNGEIYNFLELRRELEGLGHRFHSDSDTEVILASYAQWGEGCQLRFNGMWGFAIWDEKERQLFLSRDRYGVKPLHYYFDGERFAFASEMKAFFACPWFPRRYDPAMLALAITDHFAIEGGEACILAGVKHLVGGHQLVLREGGVPRVTRWWNTLDHLPQVPRRWEEQVEQYRDLFLDACRVRMRSDVALCTSLSGGMDSSAVICSMAALHAGHQDVEREPSDWRKAFIASFPGTVQDEKEYALAAAAKAAAEPIVEVIGTGSMVGNFDRVIMQMDDIYDEDIQIGAYLIYQAQRKHGLYVSLDGHGGDETLGGYRHYVQAAMHDALERCEWGRAWDLWRTLRGMLPAARKGEAGTIPGLLKMSLRKRGAGSGERGGGKAVLRKDSVSVREQGSGVGGRRGFLRVEPAVAGWRSAEDNERMKEEGRDRLFTDLYNETHGTLLPTILRQYERASMAHGVEVRSPLMDWRLIVMAFALPSASKVGHGFSKRILRSATQGIVPDAVRLRTEKMAFGNPLEEWLKGDLRPWLEDKINARSFLESEIWDGPTIRDAVARGYISGDMRAAKMAMPFVQADTLIGATR
jgi:asparagine synthase (glutamine-hydrolysing)